MGLTAEALANATYLTYLGLVPTASDAVRSNPSTGVPAHNPAQRLISGLAAGLVNTIDNLKWYGQITGTADPTGTALPLPFVFAVSAAAASSFLASAGWTGSYSALFAQGVIQGMLDNVAVLSTLQGDESLTVGTGTAVFAAPYNAAVATAAKASLLQTLNAALQAEGVFGVDDEPSAPINATLATLIPKYAEAYAAGLATLLASVPYVGAGSPTSPSTGLVTGGIS